MVELLRNPLQQVLLFDFYLGSKLNGVIQLIFQTFVVKSVKKWLSMTNFFIIIIIIITEVRFVVTIFRFLFLLLFLLILFILLHYPGCVGSRAARLKEG